MVRAPGPSNEWALVRPQLRLSSRLPDPPEDPPELTAAVGQADGLSGRKRSPRITGLRPRCPAVPRSVPVRCRMAHPAALGSARYADTIHTGRAPTPWQPLRAPVRPSPGGVPLSADACFRQQRGQEETEASTLRSRELADDPGTQRPEPRANPPCQGGRSRKNMSIIDMLPGLAAPALSRDLCSLPTRQVPHLKSRLWMEM